MKFQTLNDLAVLKLRALYDTETEVTKALPKLIRAVTDPILKFAFRDYLSETKEQISRIKKVFKILKHKPQKIEVEAIRCLNRDAAWVIVQDMVEDTRDAALVGAVRYVVHYEIAGYSALIDWMKLLGLSKAQALLALTLKEEDTTDKKLAKIGAVISKRIAQEA